MTLPDKFYDLEDNEVTLDTLCIREPLWAANRIRHLTKQVDELLELQGQLGLVKKKINAARSIKGGYPMATTCTRCDGTGFLNIDQVPNDITDPAADPYDFCDIVLEWIAKNEGHDVQVCDCCGDGEDWHGVPGEHYNDEDLPGMDGPYAYNGGLCECH